MTKMKLHAKCKPFVAMDTLSGRQMALLLNAFIYPNRSTGEHAKVLSVAAPVITRACGRLEFGEKMLRRTVDVSDRRKVHINITAHGMSFLREVLGRDAISKIIYERGTDVSK